MKEIFWMSCAECSSTQLHQPCEACVNTRGGGVLQYVSAQELSELLEVSQLDNKLK